MAEERRLQSHKKAERQKITYVLRTRDDWRGEASAAHPAGADYYSLR